MSLEGTLALAIKNYRTIVDSRRFIPLATEKEFKKIFDSVLLGLLENLSEAVKIQKPEPINDESESSTASNETFIIQVDAKKINVATDILKLLIILKHFIDQPVYADENLHEIFALAAESDLQIVSGTADFDDHKAKKRFETFIGNLYVLLCEDSSLKSNAKDFFKNLTSARLHDVLLEAAPRASHEEMYRKHYRGLLLNISDVSELVAQVIKRLDSYYPEAQTIEGISRKTFLLERLGWKNTTVLQCSVKLNQKILEACKQKNKEEAYKNLQYFWILLTECKFVAPDEFCATLFIFPSECESFLKMTEDLAECLAETTKTFGLDAKQVQMLNEINKEISIWVQRLVKAVGTNFIHFERDLNNRNYRSSNKILTKIVISLSNLSKSIYDQLGASGKANNLELVKPAEEIKTVADFIKKDSANSDENDVETSANVKEEGDFTVISIPKSPKSPKSSFSTSGPSNELENQSRVSLWTLMIAIISTLAAAFCIKHFYDQQSNKN